ncbi:hypothetical protein [Latilactobacillus fuchuensis]
MKLKHRINFKTTTWFMIALVVTLSIIFLTSLTLAVISYHNYNTYTTITM